jgi:uncharacterized DUF497 family protein
MLRFDWDEQKNKGNRTKRGIWFEEAQAFSAIHTDACFMIRSIPSTRIGSSCLV